MIEIQPYLDEYYIHVGVNPDPRPKRLALAVTDRCNSKLLLDMVPEIL